MSDLLKSAVIDATALREAALKSAEASVLEKYSNQIKEAVNSILEQDDEEVVDDFSEEGSIEDMGTKKPTSDGGLTEDIPLAATDGEKLCQCPDSEEEIEIDFDELEQQMTQETSEEDDVPSEEPSIDIALDAGEEYDLEESTLDNILEELIVDTEASKSGWNFSNEVEQQDNLENQLAKQQDTKEKEENELLKKALKELEESIKKEKKEKELWIEDNKKQVERNKKYKYVFNVLKDKIEEVTMINAKLLYTNRILDSNSLNGRQKKTLVESISKSKSAEEAKMIFESLQNVVGSTNKKIELESLHEVANRHPVSLLLSHKEKEVDNSVQSEKERMKKLAGIK